MKALNPLQALRIGVAASLLAGLVIDSHADAVTDWNVLAGEFIVEGKVGTPPANRTMAIVQTAVFEAVNAITRKYDSTLRAPLEAAPGASIEAAVAAANRATLIKLVPQQAAQIEAAYQATLATIADGAAKASGIAVGEKAAAALLAARADDGAAAAGDPYRPHTAAGAYVPTALPAVTQWPQRKPWLMATPSQFRPGPPPALGSAAWARDFNEVKAFGGRASTRRSAEQTDIARFWDYSLPSIYHGVLRSVAHAPGREPTRNARLFAAASQAMDDALIAVFEAKYTYNFWRPTTSVRNADIDGNDATGRDAGWLPLIDIPLHPEYPSGHSILASAMATVLQAEVGAGPMPVLATTSPTLKGVTRRWTQLADFTAEVSNARIWGGLHYRFSTDAATTMGKQVGELAVARFLQVPH